MNEWRWARHEQKGFIIYIQPSNNNKFTSMGSVCHAGPWKPQTVHTLLPASFQHMCTRYCVSSIAWVFLVQVSWGQGGSLRGLGQETQQQTVTGSNPRSFHHWIPALICLEDLALTRSVEFSLPPKTSTLIDRSSQKTHPLQKTFCQRVSNWFADLRYLCMSRCAPVT